MFVVKRSSTGAPANYLSDGYYLALQSYLLGFYEPEERQEFGEFVCDRIRAALTPDCAGAFASAEIRFNPAPTCENDRYLGLYVASYEPVDDRFIRQLAIVSAGVAGVVFVKVKQGDR